MRRRVDRRLRQCEGRSASGRGRRAVLCCWSAPACRGNFVAGRLRKSAAARRAVTAGDPLQHRQRRPHVRGRGGQAVAGAAAGISRRRLLPAPRGARLLAASGVAGRRRLGGAGRPLARRAALVLHQEGRAARTPTPAFAPGDVLVFGCESRGLPDELLAERADRSACGFRRGPRCAASTSPTASRSRRTKSLRQWR